MKAPAQLAALLAGVLHLAGCGSAPLTAVPTLDLARYAGDWFVVAHLPTRQEREAFDAVEHYDMRPDGRIRVRFTFREGSHEGPRRTLRMRAWVPDEAVTARWKVRPFFPLALDYVVVHLEPDYSMTVVAHPSRDYAWIMARSATVEPDVMARAHAALEREGFDTSRLRVVPHRGTTTAEGTPSADR